MQTTAKMLKKKMILMNAGIVSGLVITYFLGYPAVIVAVVGVLFLVAVNVALLIQLRVTRET
jgi:hypothetical protein